MRRKGFKPKRKLTRKDIIREFNRQTNGVPYNTSLIGLGFHKSILEPAIRTAIKKGMSADDLIYMNGQSNSYLQILTRLLNS